jgi:hypothetical protein
MSAVAAIDAKVTVGCQKDRVGEVLGHADEACVGETHRDARVLVHQPRDSPQVVAQIKGWEHGATSKKRGKGRLAARAQKVERF